MHRGLVCLLDHQPNEVIEALVGNAFDVEKKFHGLLHQGGALMQVNLLRAHSQSLKLDIERRGHLAQRFPWPSARPVHVGKLRQREDSLLLVLGSQLGRHLVHQEEAIGLLCFRFTILVELACQAVLAHA